MEPIIAIVLVLIGYALGSAKLINQGNEALVERLGKSHRTLNPGLNFIVPLIDQIVMEDTTREQFLDIKPQNIITSDNVYLEVDAVVFWKIANMRDSYYNVDDLQGALTQLATTTLREVIAQKSLQEANASGTQMRDDIKKKLTEAVKEVKEVQQGKEVVIKQDWGVEIIRVDIQRITPPENVQKSMEEQKAAEIRSQAAVKEAEGARKAAEEKAEGTRKSMEIISTALRNHSESKEILRYLVAQDYINASYRLGESENAKVVFVDPGKGGEMMDLISESLNDDGGKKGENGNGST
ncbi:membrane protease subunit, stomatin/prohibitin [Scytonema hofmannii PCC 7110]|uniref:Membrane protease subunit, stomatin/prohibitin n=1 Tax=Scytonema hofmannii PCC 7110 TaxID=128403 RepID=A0A139WVU0_9CYAN|nr:SPFH domain-containing protein [Scytonema hofmannii]KYC36546.1 membrane protease subunit, stomatin/prohibitin [Scytonema hofmannii PCC 7110]